MDREYFRKYVVNVNGKGVSMKRFLFGYLIFWLGLFIFVTPVVHAEDKAISRSGVTIRFIERTRTLEFSDDEAGKIFESGIITAGYQGKTIATSDSGTELNVTVRKEASELVLDLDNKLTTTLCIKDTPRIVIYVLGEELAEVSFRAKAVAGQRAWPVILEDTQLGDNKVVSTRLGPATFAASQSLFDPKYDLAMLVDAAGDVSWQWDNGWKLHTFAGTGQKLFSMDLLRHYYRDRLGIKYYAPIKKRSYWETAPVVAMTWYGIQGWKNKPAQKKEWLYPQIDWVAKHLLPYAEKMVFQLDDSYAYWDDKYMRDLSDYVRSKGMIPGIWFTPFTHTAPDQAEEQARQHPDWFLHDREGKLLRNFGGQNWGFLGLAGYVLNVSNPEVVSGPYGSFWHKVNETWNFDFFKIDGQPPVSRLYSESADGGGLKGYRSGLRIARKIVGPDKFINGCWGTPTAAIGLVTGSRTGGDTGDAKHAINVILRWNFLNNVAWWCDPDAAANLYKSPVEPARLNAQARVLTGQQFLTDDVWTKVPPPIRRVWQQSFPMLDIRPVNLYPIKDNWKTYDVFDLRIARPYRTWDVVGLFNYDEKPIRKELDLSRLALEAEEVYIFEYWSSTYLGRFNRDAKIVRPMKEHEGQVFSMVPVVYDRPALLSTSRHLSQGGLDLENVHWQQNGQDWIVRGQSTHLVPGDEYVMVFACGRYRVKSTHSSDSPLNVISPAPRRGGAIARLQCTPHANRTLNWQVTFEPLRKAALSVEPKQIKKIGEN